MAPPNIVSNVLPPKENALFKRIVKCYERKDYKNGLKFAKQILSNPKCAEHGETLAMKGLILNCMGKKDEAYDYVRRGLKNDVRSHVCWHVYGLLQRSDKKYDEAIKAYRNALKIDKENLQILRDLSLLQLQMRDLEGYKETRYLLFILRPAQKASWITFAVANHLLHNYDTALKLIDEFRMQQQPVKALDYEYSELLLYHIMIYREAQRYAEAYQRLIVYETNIIDKVALLETKADLLLKLHCESEASAIYRKLIDHNSENIDYYKRLEQCLGYISPDSSDNDNNMDKRLRFYEELCKKYPRSLAPKRLPLTFTHGATFVSVLNPYAKSMLRKGVPPLFVSLRSLYRDKAKVLLIEQLFLSYTTSIEKCGRFPDEITTDSMEAPTTILWVYYFLALHYDCVKDYSQALHYLDKASNHTPTLIEVFTVRAKVYKHSGYYKEAARLMDEAQSLDTADRYVNSKCAKYMLRAGMVTEAEQMCGKFTREGSSPTENLNEMQCMWFETQCAQAFFDLNKLGEALKKCHEVDRHFNDIVEDQFDFHTYCVRRMTLCAYIRMLRLEDTLRKHRWYFKAAKIAISIYIRLYDRPYDETENVDGTVSNEQISSELKKQRRKEKKQQAKNEQNKTAVVKGSSVQPAVSIQPKAAKKDDQESDEPKKEPLDARVLVKTPTPLDEALRFLKPLLQLDSQEIDAYLLGFEVFYRRNKLLMMLYCLKKCVRIDPTNPKLEECKERFKKCMSNSKCDSAIFETMLEEMEEVFPGEKPLSPPKQLEE